jgi:hypothetical protein
VNATAPYLPPPIFPNRVGSFVGLGRLIRNIRALVRIQGALESTDARVRPLAPDEESYLNLHFVKSSQTRHACRVPLELVSTFTCNDNKSLGSHFASAVYPSPSAGSAVHSTPISWMGV